jgi:hypothetical protein
VNTNHAYVAGLIDGEGCIRLQVSKATYRASVWVGMTEVALPLLTNLREEWGGSLYRLRPATERWSAAWTWVVHGTNAGTLLRVVQPYLQLKQEQARLALEVETIRAALARRPNGLGGAWTPEARQVCAAIKQQMHVLNAKGPRVSAPTVEVV